ncbi:MAG: amidohydrolase family protein [Saprospiraceae bacterium]|nr:amidohydrolase family protein [Saprospiraceae bacterium]
MYFFNSSSTFFACCLLFFTITSFSQEKGAFAITNVNVIPMDQEVVLPNQTVLIANGKIMRIGSSNLIKIPKKYAVVDGSGKYLMPGLMDMHTHFWYEQGEHKNTCDLELKMMLANGLTTVRIMAGHSAYLEARDNVKDGKWVGPELFVVSPQLAGRWPWEQDFKNFELVETPEQAVTAVKKFKKDGYSEIKITFMVKPEVFNAIIETAKKEGIKVTGHVGPLVKLPAALAAKEQIEHMDEFIEMLLPDTSYNHGQSVSDYNIYSKAAWATVPHLDESKITSLVKSVKNAGIYVTPTNYFFITNAGQPLPEAEIKALPGYNFIPADLKAEKWKYRESYMKSMAPQESRDKYIHLRKKMVYELWKAGVPLMTGSDAPEFFVVAGFATHDEIKMMVEAGLTPFAALQTATIHPATYMGIQNRKGTIAKGKDADLLLLDKNPLENITNTQIISAVFKNGIYYDEKALNELLKQASTMGK